MVKHLWRSEGKTHKYPIFSNTAPLQKPFGYNLPNVFIIDYVEIEKIEDSVRPVL